MALVTRPAAGYTPSNAITNTTKYQTDSAGSVAISSTKVDGDVNKAFDELTNQSNRLDVLEDPVAELTEAVVLAADSIVFADASDSNALKRDTVQGIIDLITPADGQFVNGGYRAGYYYPNTTIAPSGTLTTTADRLYCQPFYIHETHTFTRIGLYFDASGSGNARVGIYNWEDGLPTTLLLDAGAVAFSANSQVDATISQSLAAGVYGLAVVFSATPDVKRQASNSLNQMFTGNVDMATGSYFGYYCSHAYGALPASFGSPTGVAGTGCPFMWLRG